MNAPVLYGVAGFDGTGSAIPAVRRLLTSEGCTCHHIEVARRSYAGEVMLRPRHNDGCPWLTRRPAMVTV